MGQDVYIDLYFLINTAMDLICLQITARLLHRSAKRWRMIAGALLGGGYACFSLLLGLEGAVGFLADAFAVLLMCAVAFAERKLSFLRYLQTSAVQLLSSAMLGGIMTAFYACLNRLHLPFEILEGDGLSVWGFALLGSIAGILTANGGRLFGFSGRIRSVRVEATVFGRNVELRALVDSGNLLRDPTGGRAVIVADRETLCSALPQAVACRLRSSDPAHWLGDYETACRIRLIPARGATGETLLPALIPERLRIFDGKNVSNADYLIALAPLGESAKGFDAVIPAV